MRRKRQLATAAAALLGAAALAAAADNFTLAQVPPAADVADAPIPAPDAVPAPDPAPAPDVAAAPAADVARLPQLNINVVPPRTTVEIDSPAITIAPDRPLSIRPFNFGQLGSDLARGRWGADVNVLQGGLRGRFSRTPDGRFGLFAQAQPQPQPPQPGQPSQLGADNADQQKLLDLYRAQLGDSVKLQKGSYLGVSTSQVPAPLRQHLGLPEGIGLVIEFVEPDSPAQKAGLKQYDILKKFDDQLLVNAEQLAVLVRSRKPGDEVKLNLIRGGKEDTVSAKLVEHDVKPLDVIPFWEGRGGGGAFGGGGFGGGGNGMPGQGGGFRQWQAVPDGKGGFGVLGGGGGASARGQRSDKPEPKGRGESLSVQSHGDRTVMVYRDNDYVLTITGSPGKRHLVAADKNGKPVYEGNIDGDGSARDKMPPEVRERLERLEKQSRQNRGDKPDAPGEKREGGVGNFKFEEKRVEESNDSDKGEQAGHEKRVEVRTERHAKSDHDKDNHHEDHDGDDKDDDKDDDNDADRDERPAARAVINKDDVLLIEISDLQGPGVETLKQTRVRNGEVSMPYIGRVKAEGLTPRQLETAIVKKYADARLVANANVNVKRVTAADAPAEAVAEPKH
jgi:hypothetical protein